MSFTPRTTIEPFRIKSVEPVRRTTAGHRRTAIAAAGYNPFNLKSEDVLIDLLTDSGTSAMSVDQWAGMMRGDESYAGSRSFTALETAFRRIAGYRHILPMHQGRAAEFILFSTIARQFPDRYDLVVPNNTHFDTTRANLETQRFTAVDLLAPEGHQLATEHPFKGCLDGERLERLIDEVGPARIPICLITVTNNAGGGQPVSMANIRAVSEICRRHRIPLIIDACRFAENAMFIKLREAGYGDRTPLEIAKEMFSYADGCTFSGKKDGLVNIGGLLALNDDDLAERCRRSMVVSEGFPTYGGLAGYDMEALAVGLGEVVDESYLRYRLGSVEYLGRQLIEAGVPIVRPPGGHAVFLDAATLLPHLPPSQYPAWALSVFLYEIAGIRSVEIGSVAFGKRGPDGEEIPAPHELVRLAIPRRVYTRSHLDYVAEAVIYAARHGSGIRGMRIVAQAPVLRHFTARLEWLAPSMALSETGT